MSGKAKSWESATQKDRADGQVVPAMFTLSGCRPPERRVIAEQKSKLAGCLPLPVGLCLGVGLRLLRAVLPDNKGRHWGRKGLGIGYEAEGISSHLAKLL
jgi:hypothetical protein